MMWLHRLVLGLARWGPSPDVIVGSIFGMSEAIDKAQYKIYIGAAKILWGIDSAILSLVHLINQWRNELAYGGFTNALDVVANNTIGLSRSVFQLAVTVFLLLCVATPIIRSRWVDIRKAVVLALVIPLALPMLAASFQDIDRARTDLGATLYNDIFESSHFEMEGGGSGGTGMDRDMCELRSFTAIEDGYTTYRGVDVGAAYMCATYDDVMNPTSALPVEFARRYFEMTPSQFEEQDEAIRDRELEEAEFGLKRLAFGIILLVFALIETCVSLGFTLSLGFLFIALFIAVIFSFFSMFESFLTGVIQKIVALFLESWVISVVQALLLAGLLKVAESGVATRVLGMGVLGLMLEILFLIMAFKSMLAAMTGFAGGAGSGGVSSFEAKRTWRSAAGMAAGAAGVAAGAVTALPQAGAAYATARKQGASMSEAAGYATQSSRPLATIGTLATAMGLGGNDFVAGRAQGQFAQKRGYGLTSPLGMQGIRDRTDRREREAKQEQRQETQEQRYQASQAERTADKAQREERYQAGEARREADRPQREADRAYQLQERNRRDQERQAREAQAAREAPIRAIDRGEIAERITAAYAGNQIRDTATTPASVDDVTRGLGLHSGAFGRSTGAVQTVLNDLYETPIAPDLAQRMMVEATQEGSFRPETRAEVQRDLVASGMTEKEASSRLTTMQGHMQKLPTNIKVEDALSAEAVGQRQAGAYAGYSAEHRVQPATTEPIITPYSRPSFPTPPPPPNYDRDLPAPAAPSAAPPRPRTIGRPRPRHGAQERTRAPHTRSEA